MKLKDIGERKLIEDLFADIKNEDCAILESGDKYLLITTDMISEETHIPNETPPELIGWFLSAINLSDIASMGGSPIAFLSALGIPRETESEFLESIVNGMKNCLDKYEVKYVGGDLKESQEITISGTVVGEVEKSKVMKRDGIKEGDILAVTNKIGKGAAGFYNWAEEIDIEKGIEELLRVNPRIEEGKILSNSGVKTCMDLSDDLFSSLSILSKINNISFKLFGDEIEIYPLAQEMIDDGYIRWNDLFSHGGDYELLFTVNPENWNNVKESMNKNEFHVQKIGIAHKGENLIIKDDKEIAFTEGYNEHFK